LFYNLQFWGVADFFAPNDLTLSLFMARIFANYAHDAMSFDDAAIFTTTFD